MTKALGELMLARYTITHHDPQRGVLVACLASNDKAVQGAGVPQAKERATQALSELIGPSTKLVDSKLDEAGDLLSITVSHQAGARMAAKGFRTRIERTISTMMPGRWRAVWDLEHDIVRFEVRPTLPSSVWLPTDVPEDVDDLLSNYEDVRIPYAIDEDGAEVCWPPAKVPQMLITGGTGTGKTSTTHAIVGKITQYGWPVWVLDGKRVEFLQHRTWPNVQVVATTVPQQVALMHRVYSLVKERYRLIEEENARSADFEPLVVVLDEWAEFVAELRAWYGDIKQKGDPTQPPTLRQYASLARLARTARVHLITTMQRPDVALLGDGGGEARSNFGQRISVGRLDPQGAQMMWDSPAIGVTLPRGARQRAITTSEDGMPVEAQCYRFPSMSAAVDSAEGMLLAELRPKRARHPRLLILPPEAAEDSLPGFWDYAQTEWVRAQDRPDLDPVAKGESGRSGQSARDAASAMALLGLQPTEGWHGEGEGQARPTPPSPVRTVSPALVLERAPVDEQLDEGPDECSYDEPTPIGPTALAVGDLIQVDDVDGWVVVDEPPVDDVLAPGMIAVSWRGEDDDFGTVSLDENTFILARRPEDHIE